MSENPDATSGLLTEIDHVAIAVKDLDAAIEVAGRVPAARLGGAIEIRPVETYW
jgi:hypothetical protein